MQDIQQVLEEELSQAVEVKDPKSLHRYMMLLSQNIVSDRRYKEDQDEIKGSLKEILLVMRERFEVIDARFESVNKRFETMDRRFESMDKRFTDMQHYMDKRFETMDKRFTSLQWLIGVGFTFISVLMASLKIFP